MKPWETWLFQGGVNERVGRTLLERMERFGMTPFGHKFGSQVVRLEDGSFVRLTINKNGPVPMYFARLLPVAEQVAVVAPTGGYGSLHLWPAASDALFGWGSPFTPENRPLGTALASLDASALPYSTLTKTASSTSVTREIAINAGWQWWRSPDASVLFSWGDSLAGSALFYRNTTVGTRTWKVGAAALATFGATVLVRIFCGVDQSSTIYLYQYPATISDTEITLGAETRIAINKPTGFLVGASTRNEWSAKFSPDGKKLAISLGLTPQQSSVWELDLSAEVPASPIVPAKIAGYSSGGPGYTNANNFSRWRKGPVAMDYDVHGAAVIVFSKIMLEASISSYNFIMSYDGPPPLAPDTMTFGGWKTCPTVGCTDTGRTQWQTGKLYRATYTSTQVYRSRIGTETITVESGGSVLSEKVNTFENFSDIYYKNPVYDIFGGDFTVWENVYDPPPAQACPSPCTQDHFYPTEPPIIWRLAQSWPAALKAALQPPGTSLPSRYSVLLVSAYATKSFSPTRDVLAEVIQYRLAATKEIAENVSTDERTYKVAVRDTATAEPKYSLTSTALATSRTVESVASIGLHGAIISSATLDTALNSIWGDRWVTGLRKHENVIHRKHPDGLEALSARFDAAATAPSNRGYLLYSPHCDADAVLSLSGKAQTNAFPYPSISGLILVGG